MRILHLSASDHPVRGGIQTAAHAQARELIAANGVGATWACSVRSLPS